MPLVKDSLALLVESARTDLTSDIARAMSESAILESYRSIPTVSQEVVYTAEMIPVVKINNECFTEMNFLQPYMKTNNITSITEALNNIAKANDLNEGAVGLLVESECCVTDAIKDAIESGNMNKRKNAYKKVSKSTAVIAKLENSGITVKKKCSESDEDVCPKCGKKACICECDPVSNNKPENM